MTTPALTIVIPAFNERRFIGRLLAELRRYTAAFPVQIIVVDNGSEDGTVAIAKEGGADLVLQELGTVAAIRNTGAKHADAEVLAFMDADVFPTAVWAARMPDVIAKIRRERRILTGSWVSVPEDCSWVERHWFEPLEHGQNSHLNSGHMITSRELFEELAGFNPELKTGEDFDLSMRARDAGAQLIDDESLKVIHEGYPKTVLEFVRREIWHGAGDCQTLSRFLTSKIAMLGFVIVHSQIAAWLVSLMTSNPLWGAATSGTSLAVAAAASVRRYRSVRFSTRVVTTVLYFCYFIARGLSSYAVRRKRRSRTIDEGRH